MALRMILLLGLFCSGLFTFPSPSWSHPSSDRFRACRVYEPAIKDAVKTYWGAYQFPKAWEAQIYQESLCNPNAISHAGASGLSQFMGPTWRDVAAQMGIQATPFDDIAIDAGAYYMARMMAVWTSKRAPRERWLLGLASYNAGAGNIIKAQRLCNGAILWRNIQNCLPQVTGRNSQETVLYTVRIERWRKELEQETWWKHSRITNPQ